MSRPFTRSGKMLESFIVRVDAGRMRDLAYHILATFSDMFQAFDWGTHICVFKSL